MNSQLWWYVARSGGVVAWGLAAVSVVWGLVLSSGVLGKRMTPPKLLDLHRFLGGLSIVFVAVHLVGLFLDEKVEFGPSELLVPMASKWEPGAVAWGIVAFYLLVAVEITSLLRSRIGERAWRFAHYGAFAVFLFGTIHGLRAGTDVENPMIWWPAAITSAAVVGLCAYRIFAGDPVRAASRTERVSASVLERTLSELERLDTDSYPSAAPGSTVAPTIETLPPEPTRALVFEPLAPAHDPMFPDAPVTVEPDRPRPVQPPLPTRTPRRVPATTAPAASLGAWRPAAVSATAAVGPPPPPDAIDPETGEPDPHAYRKWLREWLDYVEAQP